MNLLTYKITANVIYGRAGFKLNIDLLLDSPETKASSNEYFSFDDHLSLHKTNLVIIWHVKVQQVSLNKDHNT